MSTRTKKKVRVVVEGEFPVWNDALQTIGRGVVYRNGHVDITLDALPVNGKIIITLPGEFT